MRRRSTGFSSRDRPGDGPKRIERLLDALNVTPRRSWGQNFLVDRLVAAKEAALIDVPGEEKRVPLVVEIGGGLGDVTRAILERGLRPITVIEKDPRLVAFLKINFRDAVRVLEGDALVVPLPEAWAYAGNLPFSTAAAILERLMEAGMQHGVFLVQKELSERLVSPHGRRAYGPLSVLARVHGEFVVAERVPSEAFYPPPKVEGALVVFHRNPLTPPPISVPLLKTLLASAFMERRKRLNHPLPKALIHLLGESADVEKLLREAKWPKDWQAKRAEEIPPEDFVRLANMIWEKRPENVAWRERSKSATKRRI